MIAAALPDTTTSTITAMVSAETQGSTRSTRSTNRPAATRTTSPATTGRSTVLRMSVTITPASTSRNCPASSSVSGGVTSGASTVDTVATDTESATSPRARNVTTLDAVPLGAQPTRITPAASCGGRCSAVAISHPSPGMIT